MDTPESEVDPTNMKCPLDHHFLNIATKMEGFSLPVIAAALSYRNEANLNTISQKITTERNKIAELMLSWKNENKSRCTWNDLKDCLKQLNKPELMEFISREANGDLETQQSLALIFDDKYCEMESYHLDIQFQESIQATTFEDTESSRLVVSESTTSNSIPRNISKLQKKFSLLQTEVYDKLRERSKRVQIYITSRLQEPIGNDDILGPENCEYLVKSSLFETFKYLNVHGYWSFLNYYLLEEIITEFDKSLESCTKLSKYADDVAIFMRDTKLCDFLKVWPKILSEHSYPNRGIVITKLKKFWKDCTLKDVAEAQEFIAGMFGLKRFALNFCDGKEGCVELRWLVPLPAFMHMLSTIESIKGVKRLSEKNIFFIAISEMDPARAENEHLLSSVSDDEKVSAGIDLPAASIDSIIRPPSADLHAASIESHDAAAQVNTHDGADITSESYATDEAVVKQPQSGYKEDSRIPPKAASTMLRRIHSDSHFEGQENSIGVTDPKEFCYKYELEACISKNNTEEAK